MKNIVLTLWLCTIAIFGYAQNTYSGFVPYTFSLDHFENAQWKMLFDVVKSEELDGYVYVVSPSFFSYYHHVLVIGDSTLTYLTLPKYTAKRKKNNIKYLKNEIKRLKQDIKAEKRGKVKDEYGKSHEEELHETEQFLKKCKECRLSPKVHCKLDGMSEVNDRINSLINIAGTTVKPYEKTFFVDSNGKKYHEIVVDGTRYYVFPVRNKGRKFSQSFTTHSSRKKCPAGHFVNIMGKIIEMTEKGEVETSKLYPEMKTCYEELLKFVPENDSEYYKEGLKQYEFK